MTNHLPITAAILRNTNAFVFTQILVWTLRNYNFNIIKITAAPKHFMIRQLDKVKEKY